MDEHAAPEAAPSRPHAKAGPSIGERFTGGVLESASHILGSTSASIFVAGLVGPYIAALSAPRDMSARLVLGVTALALLLSVTAGVGAMLLRGLAHCAPHGALAPKSARAKGAGQ